MQRPECPPHAVHQFSGIFRVHLREFVDVIPGAENLPRAREENRVDVWSIVNGVEGKV